MWGDIDNTCRTLELVNAKKEIERLQEENARLTENLAAIEAPCDSCSGDGTYKLDGIPQVCPVCVPLGAVELIGRLAKLVNRLAEEPKNIL